MITPEVYNQLKIESYNIHDIITKIDDEIKRYAIMKQYDWIHLVLDDEYPICVRNTIGKMYVENGWYKAYHKTSSESGEKYGLTSFILTIQDNDKKFKEAFMKNGNEYFEVTMF